MSKSSKALTAAALAVAWLTAGPVLAQSAPPAPALSGLSLQQALALAQERNPDLRLSAIAVRNAEAAVLSASAAPNPTLSIQSSSINPRTGVGSGGLRDKNIDTTVRLDQLIERGGKRELRTENARRLVEASRLDVNDTRRQLTLATSEAYYDLLAAQERLAVTQETTQLFDSTLEAAQRRRKAGDIAGADVERLQVDVLRARNDARLAQADLARAQLALAQLLNVCCDTAGIRATDPWPGFEASDNVADIDRLIEQRPDVRAAQARLEAAQAARQLALASRTRDVSVGVQFEHAPGDNANNTYGLAVQIPLFVRYNFEGEIRSAEANLDTAREVLDKTRIVARNDASRALQDLQAAADRARRFEQELLVAAKKSADAAEFGFRNGASAVMDVLDARRTYRATQLDAVTARADYARALSAWRTAVMKEEGK
ncbi:TolC family protein [Noviherbaspirillum humi]|nr:TolC family protein [Noviherbaspirillum humi]